MPRLGAHRRSASACGGRLRAGHRSGLLGRRPSGRLLRRRQARCSRGLGTRADGQGDVRPRTASPRPQPSRRGVLAGDDQALPRARHGGPARSFRGGDDRFRNGCPAPAPHRVVVPGGSRVRRVSNVVSADQGGRRLGDRRLFLGPGTRHGMPRNGRRPGDRRRGARPMRGHTHGHRGRSPNGACRGGRRPGRRRWRVQSTRSALPGDADPPPPGASRRATRKAGGTGRPGGRAVRRRAALAHDGTSRGVGKRRRAPREGMVPSIGRHRNCARSRSTAARHLGGPARDRRRIRRRGRPSGCHRGRSGTRRSAQHGQWPRRAAPRSFRH